MKVTFTVIFPQIICYFVIFLIFDRLRSFLGPILWRFLFLLENWQFFRNCDTSQGKRLIDCNKPEQEKKYTVLFQDTNPSPYGLEFLPGQTYYYICKSKFIFISKYFFGRNWPISKFQNNIFDRNWPILQFFWLVFAQNIEIKRILSRDHIIFSWKVMFLWDILWSLIRS